MKKLIRSFSVLLLLILLLPLKVNAEDKRDLPQLIIFYAPGCRRCIELEKYVMPGIEKEFKNRIGFEYRDVSREGNYKFLLGLMQKCAVTSRLKTPVFYLNGKFLEVANQVDYDLRNFILAALKTTSEKLSPEEVDLEARFRSFVPLAIVAAGLEDGINPCAFTVIVFFISFLALQGYRRRELIFIGAAFIGAVFLTYLFIGLGIFNFLYRLRYFMGVTRWINIIIGSGSLFLGALAVYDFIKLKETGSTDSLILQLPKTIKLRIHQVVGFFHRRAPQEKTGGGRVSIYRLIFSACLSGFLVSLLEAVCTGQVYLPTITFILKSNPLRPEALGYLLLYNIMFILPLAVIFIFALMGATSADFSSFLKKRLGLVKILMAVLFFSLGALLIWKG